MVVLAKFLKSSLKDVLDKLSGLVYYVLMTTKVKKAAVKLIISLKRVSDLTLAIAENQEWEVYKFAYLERK